MVQTQTKLVFNAKTRQLARLHLGLGSQNYVEPITSACALLHCQYPGLTCNFCNLRR